MYVTQLDYFFPLCWHSALAGFLAAAISTSSMNCLHQATDKLCTQRAEQRHDMKVFVHRKTSVKGKLASGELCAHHICSSNIFKHHNKINNNNDEHTASYMGEPLKLKAQIFPSFSTYFYSIRYP